MTEFQVLNDQLYARRALAALLSDVLPGGHSREPLESTARRRLEVLREELERVLRGGREAA